MSMQPKRSPIPAVGVVCLRDHDVLLVRRGTPPMEDRWSIPGGRIEWGERAADAALRELKEETSCEAELLGLVDVVDAVFTRRGEHDAWGHYVLIDYAARWVSGEGAPSEELGRVIWADEQEAGALPLTQGLAELLTRARGILAST